MSRIKNMGSATMKFNEGIIVTGSDDHTFAIYASGSVEAEALTLDSSTEPAVNFSVNGDDRARIAINTSNNLVFHNQFINKHIVFKVNDQSVTREAFRIDGAVSEVVVNQGDDSLVDFRVETDNKTHAIFTDGQTDQVLILSGGGATSNNESKAPDVSFYVSGAVGSRGGSAGGTTLFGGDLVVSGSLTAVQTHIVTVKYTNTSDGVKKYVRFNSNGSNNDPGVNNKYVVPVAGVLKRIAIRSTHSPGQMNVGFHRAVDGTEDYSTTAIESQVVNLSVANTTAFADFTGNANFGPGDVIGLSVHPVDDTKVHGNVNITMVLEFDFTM